MKLKKAAAPKPDKLLPGQHTAEEWARKWKMHPDSVRKLLRAGIRNGTVAVALRYVNLGQFVRKTKVYWEK